MVDRVDYVVQRDLEGLDDFEAIEGSTPRCSTRILSGWTSAILAASLAPRELIARAKQAEFSFSRKPLFS